MSFPERPKPKECPDCGRMSYRILREDKLAEFDSILTEWVHVSPYGGGCEHVLITTVRHHPATVYETEWHWTGRTDSPRFSPEDIALRGHSLAMARYRREHE